MASHSPPVVTREHVPLHPLSTIGVGGPARWFARAHSHEDVRRIHQWCLDRDLPLFILGGGSNIIVSDDGFNGVVLAMTLSGRAMTSAPNGTIVTAGAGESWDQLVDWVVGRELSGVECLSGIPGTVGGTPIQNVGAYGQEVAGVIERVTVFDRTRSEFAELSAADCGFSYRASRFKAEEAGRFIVCGVSFLLTRSRATLSYPELLAEMERRRIGQPKPNDVRDVVLAIRRRKGMVLDEGDPDTRSVGSFFMNPVVSVDDRERIAVLARDRVPGFPAADSRVKIPAAWLIERTGLRTGSGERTVGLSSKHPLAIVNRGGATARDVILFAVQVKRAVLDWCGVWLRPEPVFVGLDGDEDVEFLKKAHG
jgi:UDP-N-acetylmuramate dehydrogenase